MSSVAPSARVVVGVDGSAGSRAALVAALQEAGRTGAEVEVVATYFPTDSWTDATLVLVQSVEAIRADLQRRTEELVGDVLREHVGTGGASRVRTGIHEGPVAEVLLQRARGAQLLVVGSRGREAIRALLLGSVALHCAMHAPVMLVHPQRSKSTEGDTASEPAMAEL
jgi:nucleotide-binding universal stress UspA family protein